LIADRHKSSVYHLTQSYLCTISLHFCDFSEFEQIRTYYRINSMTPDNILSSSSFEQPVFWQIKWLVQSLNKKNHKSVLNELLHLRHVYGFEAQVFFLRTLFEEEFRSSNKGTEVRSHLLINELEKISADPRFGAVLLQALETFGADDVSSSTGKAMSHTDFFSTLLKRLALKQQLAFCVALLSCDIPAAARSGGPLVFSRFRESCLRLLKQRLKDFVNHPQQLPEYVVHNLLCLLRSEAFLNGDQLTHGASSSAMGGSQNSSGAAAEDRECDYFIQTHLQTVIRSLLDKHPSASRHFAPFSVLGPIIPTNVTPDKRVALLRPRPADLLDGGKNDCDIEMFCDGALEISLAGMLKELGPDCCLTPQDLERTFRQWHPIYEGKVRSSDAADVLLMALRQNALIRNSQNDGFHHLSSGTFQFVNAIPNTTEKDTMQSGLWRVDELVDIFKKQNLDWEAVFQKLDGNDLTFHLAKHAHSWQKNLIKKSFVRRATCNNVKILSKFSTF
jgi:hypothetical protein